MHKTSNVLPVSDEYLLAIGHFITQWAEFEADMNDLLTVLKPDPEPISAPFQARKTEISKLLRLYVHDRAAQLELTDILNTACDLAPKRDAIAHGKWLKKGGKLKLTVKNFRPRIVLASYPWSASQIEKFACRLGDAIRRFRLLETKHIAPAYTASLRKSSPQHPTGVVLGFPSKGRTPKPPRPSNPPRSFRA